MSSEPPASNVGGVNEAWLRRRPSRGDVALIAVTTVVGGVAGGWLDYNNLSDNEGFRALAVRFVAIVVALLAGVVWSRRHGQRAKVVVLASATLLVASLKWRAGGRSGRGHGVGTRWVHRVGASRAESVASVCARAFDGAGTMRTPGFQANPPRTADAARRTRCSSQARSRQASCGLPRLPRAVPVRTGSTATALVTVEPATPRRTGAMSRSCPTRAASPAGAARIARPVRARRTSSVVS